MELDEAIKILKKKLSHITRDYRPEDQAFDVLCKEAKNAQAQLAGLRRDAERYRFMRSRTITPSAAVACASAVDELYGDEMDAAIDDAMKPNAQVQPASGQEKSNG